MDYLPFTYEDWYDSDDNGGLNFTNVTMTKDFGPIKKGEKFGAVNMELFEGYIHFFKDKHCVECLHEFDIGYSIHIEEKE